jgi:hypothetical protein
MTLLVATTLEEWDSHPKTAVLWALVCAMHRDTEVRRGTRRPMPSPEVRGWRGGGARIQGLTTR